MEGLEAGLPLPSFPLASSSPNLNFLLDLNPTVGFFFGSHPSKTELVHVLLLLPLLRPFPPFFLRPLRRPPVTQRRANTSCSSFAQNASSSSTGMNEAFFSLLIIFDPESFLSLIFSQVHNPERSLLLVLQANAWILDCRSGHDEEIIILLFDGF